MWPVLVFEKTSLGDLDHFVRYGKGRLLPVEDKLRLCFDVGVAIRDMHENSKKAYTLFSSVSSLYIEILHGDIKPRNVLIFENWPGNYIPKVADFGFSTYFGGEQSLIKMPQSEPWNAPEYHCRHHEPRAARAMDVYSFGMLCLWLIFGQNIAVSPTLSPPAESNREYVNFEETFQVQKLESWKIESDYKVLERAFNLTSKCDSLHWGGKNDLADFFRSTLALYPDQRSTDFTYLLNLLLPFQ